MFFKEFDESTKDEIVLENVEAEELQKFLETINEELCIDGRHSNITQILAPFQTNALMESSVSPTCGVPRLR